MGGSFYVHDVIKEEYGGKMQKGLGDNVAITLVLYLCERI